MSVCRYWINRIGFSGCIAGILWAIGEGLNIPIWRDWVPVDRADMALLGFWAAWLASAQWSRP